MKEKIINTIIELFEFILITIILLALCIDWGGLIG